jgi:hypothetical protein
MRTLAEEAADCRRAALEFPGRPEQPLLLKLASAFEELALVPKTEAPAIPLRQ